MAILIQQNIFNFIIIQFVLFLLIKINFVYSVNGKFEGSTSKIGEEICEQKKDTEGEICLDKDEGQGSRREKINFLKFVIGDSGRRDP